MSLSSQKNIQYETIEMQKIRFAIQREIDQRDLIDENIRAHIYESMARNLVIELEGFIWAETISEPYEYKVPTKTHIQELMWIGPNWLRKLLSRWLVSVPKRIPMKTEKLDVRVCYPKLKTALPKERSVMKVMKYEASY